MHTVVKKHAPPTPSCSLPTAQDPDDMSGPSAAATTASSPENQDLTIHLPDGSTALVSINPSKPMMDLLIKICGQLHLSPAEHSLQVFMGDSSWPVSYKANQTLSSLGVSTVKLVSKKLEKDKLKSSTQQPFEITQRLIVSLPNNQKYVMRVKPEILLSELFKLATAHKGLDPQSYKLCHPSNPDFILNMDSPLNVYGFSEIGLAKVTSIKGEVVTYQSERQNLESNMHGTARPMASISESQSSKSVQEGSQTRAMASVPITQSTTSSHHTMQKSPSLPGPESKGFMPSTSFEKKKGFLSFLKRKKSGKFSLGGSMQNLHQIDSGSTATIARQQSETPMNSRSQLHRNSLHTSSTLTLASPPLQMLPTPTASHQLQLQIPAASKKRPAPQPPGVLLPLTTDSGTGRLVRPPPRLPGTSHPVTARSGVEDSVQLSPQLPGVVQPSQCEGSGDAAVQLTYGIIGHSPSSSQSSGFEEMSPSPLEESKKPAFPVAGSGHKPDSAASNMNGGMREEGGGGGECNSGSTVHFDYSLLQKAGQSKRRAPPPPAVAVQPTGVPVYSEAPSSTKPTPPSSLSSDNSGSSSLLNEATTGCTASDGLHGFSAQSRTVSGAVETDKYFSSGQDALESGGNFESGLFYANAVDDGDAAALAAEAEDCFCETDIGYDGEIVFDCADITFVVPEMQRPNARVLAESSKGSTTSEQCKKPATQSHNANTCSAEKLNFRVREGENPSQLLGFVLESKAADVLHSTESGEVSRRNLQLTSDERKVLENYDPLVNGEDYSNRVGAINGQFLDETDYSTNSNDRRNFLGQAKNSDKLSHPIHLNNVGGSNCSSENIDLNRLASTEVILDCSASAVIPVALETHNNAIAMAPSVRSDNTLENDHRISSHGVDDSALTSLPHTGETASEPRTIIINKSKTVPIYSTPNIPNVCEVSSVKSSSLEPLATEGSELQSQTIVVAAGAERIVQTTNQLSNETREKLSNDDFLLDRSLCSRYYPSMNQPLPNNSCETVDATALSCANIAEKTPASISNESAPIKPDRVVPTSLSSDPKSECSQKTLYHLVRHSPPVATNDSEGVVDSCRKTVDCNESKPALHITEKQSFKAPEKVERQHSSNASFTVELQRHLSRWQQQHSTGSGAPPEKSPTVVCYSDASPSSLTKNTSSINSLSSSNAMGNKEVKDRRSVVNSANGQTISALPATSGSLVMANGPNTRPSVANSSSGSAVANNKGLSKTDVVFTMEQLLNAKSGLKRTARSENSSSEVSQNETVRRSQNLQSSVTESKASIRSVTSAAVSSQQRMKVPSSQESSDGGVCSSGNNIPAPPSLPAFVGNHVEKKVGSSGQMTEGRRNLPPNKPRQDVDFRDELLSAIRNAGGKPMKCKVVSG